MPHRMLRPRLMPLLVALAASACAVGPDYQRPSVDSAAEFKEAAGWKAAEPQQPALSDAWWRTFGDAQLDGLVAQIDVSNQNLRSFEAQYRQAVALAEAARAAWFPTLNATASATRSATAAATATAGNAPPRNSFAVGASVAWEADVWGRIAKNADAADLRAAASAADLAAARLSAQASLAQSYFQLRAADEQLRLLARTIAAYERSLQLTRHRYAAGVAAKSDVVQAETLLHSARASAEDVALSRSQYEHAIAVLIGKAPANFTLAAVDVPLPTPSAPQVLPSTLLERRPDIAAAEQRVAAANAAIGAAQAARFPVLGLSASGGFRRSDVADLFTLPSRYWSLGPTLAATIFDAGAKKAAVGQAQASWEQAVATYRQTVLTAFQEVEDNLAAARHLEAAAAEQAAAVAAAAEAQTIAENQYRAGTVSYLNVVSAQTTHLNARIAANTLSARRVAAAVQLAKNTGGSLTLPSASAAPQ